MDVYKTFVKLCRKVSLADYCLGQHSDGRSPMPAADCALQSGSSSQPLALVMPLCPAAPLREREETYMAVASARLSAGRSHMVAL